MELTNDDELLTVEQTAEELQVCEKTVHNLFNRGELHRVRIAKKAVRVRRGDLREFIQRATEPA